jgi:hypothetical protein
MHFLNKVAVVIQGPSLYVKNIKKAFNGSHIKLIFSTWNDEEPQYESSDIVVLSEKPNNTGPHNLNLQKITTLAGIKKAKELKFDYVLKWRSDMIPTNIIDLLKLFDFEKVNFLSWHNHSGGYFCDYFTGGKIETIFDLWNFPENNYKYPEEAITQHFFKTLHSNNYINFILKKLSEKNDILWLKYKTKLSSYKQDKLFTDQFTI